MSIWIASTKSWTRVTCRFLLIKKSQQLSSSRSWGEEMTRIASFCKNRACFNARRAWHIPSLMVCLDLLHGCRKSVPSQKEGRKEGKCGSAGSTGNQSLCACTAHGALPQEHCTCVTCVAALSPTCLRLAEGQPRKMAAGAGLSDWVLFKG